MGVPSALEDYKSLSYRLRRLNRLRSVVGALGALIFLDLHAETALEVKGQGHPPHTIIKINAFFKKTKPPFQKKNPQKQHNILSNI